MGERAAPPLGRTLNLADPLSRGLLGAWLFNDGAGTTVPDMGPYGLVGSIRGTAFTKTPAQGLSNSTNSVSDGAEIPASPILNALSGDVTAVAVLRLTATPTNTIYAFIKWQGGAYPCAILITTSGIANWQVSDGGAGCTVSSPTSIIDGKTHVLVGTRTGNVSSFYIDGVLIGTASASLGSTANSGNLGLGNDPTSDGTQTKPIIGSMRAAMLWNRGMSPSEAQALSASPYQMFARKPLLYKSAGGSPITATGTGAEGEGLSGTTTQSQAASGTAGEGEGVSGNTTQSEAAAASAGEGQGVSGTATLSDAATGSGAEGEGATGSATQSQAATGSAGEGESVSGFTGVPPDIATGSAAEGEGVAGTTTQSESATGTGAQGESVTGISTQSESATAQASEGESVSGAATLRESATGSAAQGESVSGSATITVPGAPTPLKSTRVFAGPLIRATRIYAGPLIRVTRVETFPS